MLHDIAKQIILIQIWLFSCFFFPPAGDLLSPGGGTTVVGATDRFSSPTPGNAKRRLFGVGPAAAVAVANSTTNSTFTTSTPSPSPGTSNAQVCGKLASLEDSCLKKAGNYA